MCKYAESFITNKDFFIIFLIFKIEICGIFLKRYFGKNEALLTSSFYIKIYHFNIVFHMTWEKWQHLRPWGLVFGTGPFFRGSAFYQAQDPGFSRCRIENMDKHSVETSKQKKHKFW